MKAYELAEEVLLHSNYATRDCAARMLRDQAKLIQNYETRDCERQEVLRKHLYKIAELKRKLDNTEVSRLLWKGDYEDLKRRELYENKEDLEGRLFRIMCDKLIRDMSTDGHTTPRQIGIEARRRIAGECYCHLNKQREESCGK